MLAELEAFGYSVVPNAVSPAALVAIAAAYDRAFAEAMPPDLRTSRSGGDTRLIDFVNRGSAFDALYLLEPVLGVCRGVFGNGFKLSAFGGRTVLSGARAQPLHVDVLPEEAAWPLVGFIVMIDDFRADNGATRFVRGSHRGESLPLHEGQQHPDTGHHAFACGAAGSVIVYLGSTWHGYSANRSGAPRRSIQGAYIPRTAASAVDWASRMSVATRYRLSVPARYVLALEQGAEGF